MSVIGSSQIEAMVAQLRAAAEQTQSKVNPLKNEEATEKVDFSQALKTTLDEVNATQVNAENLGDRFVAGDENVNLSDVMIAVQKANISMQATIQVRNKLVSAYQDIMNMSI